MNWTIGSASKDVHKYSVIRRRMDMYMLQSDVEGAVVQCTESKKNSLLCWYQKESIGGYAMLDFLVLSSFLSPSLSCKTRLLCLELLLFRLCRQWQTACSTYSCQMAPTCHSTMRRSPPSLSLVSLKICMNESFRTCLSFLLDLKQLHLKYLKKRIAATRNK